LIEEVGTVVSASDAQGLRRLTIRVDEGFLQGVEAGDSIAVDGACLTPVEVGEDRFRVDVVASTLERTVAGRYGPGHRVNLERAMALGDRLDGHLVQGHVDGIAILERIREEGETRFLRFRLPPEVHGATISHGSIALNGISLTVSALEDPDLLEVAIIPHTWERTNLRELRCGDEVNVEGDLIGKYVGRLLRGTLPPSP
jgi:riboflavin synthase